MDTLAARRFAAAGRRELPQGRGDGRSALPLLVLPLLFLAFSAGACGGGERKPAGTPAETVYTRIPLRANGVQVPAFRPGTLIAEHRFDQDRMGEELFLLLEGEGEAFIQTQEPRVPAFGVRSERGTRTIAAPVAALGGASALARASTAGASFFCPGENGLKVTFVGLDEERRELFRSDSVWLKRGADLTSVLFPLPTVRPTHEVRFVGVEISGPDGIRSISGLWLTDPVPGSELPPAASPAPYALRSNVREAAALVEEHPWTARVSATRQSYLRAALHVPRLYRGASGELPRVTLEVSGADWTQRYPIPLPLESADDWHDVKLSLLGDRASAGEDLQLRLIIEDDYDGITAAALVGEASVFTPKKNPRTVLLITSDTHRADYVGLYGSGGRVSTPTLDALSRRGAFFEDCQTTTNITTPAHVAIMTGLHPRDTAVVDNSTRVKDEADTLAERFGEAGFRTFAAVSVSHLTHSHSGLGQGFDRFYNPVETEQPAGVTVKALGAWLEDAAGEDAFLWLHLFDAHAPYRPRGPRASVSAGVAAGAPAIEITSEMLSGRGVPGWLRNIEVTGLDEIRGWYGGEVVEVDEALDSLLSRPRVAEGWVALTSDHGENLGENRRTFEHTGLFQPVLQVPMILAGPGVPTMRTAAAVQQFSIGRTLLELAGVDTSFPGRSLLETARNEDLEEPRFGLSGYGDHASITAGKWLLTLGLRTDTRKNAAPDAVAGRVHLFDRTLGIQSEENFAEREPEVARKLHRALRGWLNAQGETPPLAEAGVRSARAQRRLRALGYSGQTTDGDQKWWDPERVEDPKWRTYW